MAVINKLNSARTQMFAYDALSRVSTAQTNGTSGSNCFGFQFTYDAWANITDNSVLSGYSSCTNTVGFAFDPPMNAENRITTSGFNYDPWGTSWPKCVDVGPATKVSCARGSFGARSCIGNKL